MDELFEAWLQTRLKLLFSGEPLPAIAPLPPAPAPPAPAQP
jgi:hypothetical protein